SLLLSTLLFYHHDPTPTPLYTLFPTRRSSDLGSPSRCGVDCSTRTEVDCSSSDRLCCCGSGEPRSAEERSENFTVRLLEALCIRSEEHTSELQSLAYLVCRLLLEKKKNKNCSI